MSHWSTTSARARSAMAAARSGSRSKAMTRAANSPGASARAQNSPSFTARPSAPTFVDTTGMPAANASNNFTDLQSDDAGGEFTGSVGQGAELAILHGQALGAHFRGHHRDARGECLQQLYAHPGPAQNRADENGIARQWFADVLHVA